jgi:hypothetical protein
MISCFYLNELNTKIVSSTIAGIESTFQFGG